MRRGAVETTAAAAADAVCINHRLMIAQGHGRSTVGQRELGELVGFQIDHDSRQPVHHEKSVHSQANCESHKHAHKHAHEDTRGLTVVRATGSPRQSQRFHQGSQAANDSHLASVRESERL